MLSRKEVLGLIGILIPAIGFEGYQWYKMRKKCKRVDREIEEQIKRTDELLKEIDETNAERMRIIADLRERNAKLMQEFGYEELPDGTIVAKKDEPLDTD